MQKPSGYEEAQAGGEFTPVNLGGHYCVVKQVTERQSSTGKDMIVVLFDFCKPDEQVNYFIDQFNNDNRSDKKWPFPGSKYIMVNDYVDPGKTSRQFKTFCTCIEKSNNYTIQWGGANWASQFKGKKIGVVFGIEEKEYDGKVSQKHLPRWFCSFDTVKDAKTPEPKFLSNENGGGPRSAPKQNVQQEQPFINIPEGVDEEIPF